MKNRTIKLASLLFLCFLFCLSGCKSSASLSNGTYTENEITTLILKYNLKKTSNANFKHIWAEAQGGTIYEMLSEPLVTEIIYPFDGKKAYFAEFTYKAKKRDKHLKGIILCSEGEFKDDSFKYILKIKKGDEFRMLPDYKYYGKETRVTWIMRADAPLIGR